MAKSVNEEFGLGLSDDSAVLDPEQDRANWPVIHIEPEEGKPNYEFLGAHGTMQNGEPFGHELQVMRGVDVAVPPSIVRMLQTSVGAHYKSVPDPDNPGKNRLLRQDRSSVPWRLVKAGRYIS